MTITDTANMETEIKSKHAIRSSKYTTNCKQHKKLRHKSVNKFVYQLKTIYLCNPLGKKIICFKGYDD